MSLTTETEIIWTRDEREGDFEQWVTAGVSNASAEVYRAWTGGPWHWTVKPEFPAAGDAPELKFEIHSGEAELPPDGFPTREQAQAEAEAVLLRGEAWLDAEEAGA
jgi:hypothetical protein